MMNLPFGKQIILLMLTCLLLMGKQAAGTEIFRILNNENESLQCRIDLIRQAKHEILVSYYILKDDKIGKCLFSLLTEAACERGVTVRVIMDSNEGRVDKSLLAFLKNHDVEVRKFRIGKWYFLRRYSHRLHDKMLLVDNKWLIAGGRNLKEVYYELGTSFNFLDRDVLVSGNEVCAYARLHFYSIWNAAYLSRATRTGKISPKRMQNWTLTLAASRNALSGVLPIRFDTLIDWAGSAPPLSHTVHFICDHFLEQKEGVFVETEQKDHCSTDDLIALMDSARQSILIENPYFNPTPTWNAAFQRALARGVRMRVLTNSINSSDALIHQASYLNQRKKLLRMGMEIFEYQGPKKLHIKAFIIDNKISVIGSYNIHSFSEHNNSEIAVWVSDTSTARIHGRMMDKNLLRALRIGQNNHPIRPEGTPFPPASFDRRLRTFIFRYTIAPVLRFQTKIFN